MRNDRAGLLTCRAGTHWPEPCVMISAVLPVEYKQSKREDNPCFAGQLTGMNNAKL